MTLNQLLALKPGDKVTMRNGWRKYYTVEYLDTAWWSGHRHGVRLHDCASLYWNDEIEHYKDEGEQ